MQVLCVLQERDHFNAHIVIKHFHKRILYKFTWQSIQVYVHTDVLSVTANLLKKVCLLLQRSHDHVIRWSCDHMTICSSFFAAGDSSLYISVHSNDYQFCATGNMKTHMRKAHPDQTIVHAETVDAAELVYYEPASTAGMVVEEEEEQSAVSGQDNTLTAAVDEPMDPGGDDNQYLLYNMRDHL